MFRFLRWSRGQSFEKKQIDVTVSQQGWAADMTPLKTCTTALVLFGSIATADNAQMDLARQIEDSSTTSNQAYFDTGESVGWTLYPPLIYRREMRIMDCDVTARTVQVNPHNATEETRIEITFDLTRTRIPEPTVPIGEDYAFLTVNGDEPNGTALFELSFLPPYEPVIWSMTSGEELQSPVRFTRFLMEPVLNEEQPRRLLALLNQYKAEYCTPSG